MTQGLKPYGQPVTKSKDDDDVPVKISQDHYRHIHEQRDFTLENLSMAGQTDVVDYEDLRVMPEFDFESDAPVNSGDPHVSYRFRVPEAIRVEQRVKNRYYYIGGVPLSQCQVETVPVIQSLQDDALLYEYSFIADQFCWLQDQKYPQDNPDWVDGGTENRFIVPLNPQLVKFFEHYMVCLVRRLDSMKRLKTKELEAGKPIAQIGETELRDYQRESY